ncbi:MAG: extracellular solute-binding protein [Nitrososphaerales archaeon]
MPEVKRVDRRKFIYAGLGAAIVVVGGVAAYLATRPPERVVETVVQTQVQTVRETQVQTVEKPIERVVTQTIERPVEKTIVTTVAGTPTTIVQTEVKRETVVQTQTVEKTVEVTAPTTPMAPVTLKLWEFGGIPAEHDHVRGLASDYKNFKPYVTVEWANQDWVTKREFLIAQFKAGTAADIVTQDTASIPDFVALGAFQPLEDVDAEAVAQEKKRYYPEVWDTVTYQGKSYGFPTYVDINTMYTWSVPMLEEAGIKPPFKNWDDMLEALLKLNKPPDRYAISIPMSQNTNDILIFEGIAYANGARWLSEDGKKVTVNTDAWSQALQFYVDLVNKYKVVPPGPTSADYFVSTQLFFTKRVALTVGMSWIPALVQLGAFALDWQYKLAPFPSSPYPPGPTIPFMMEPTTTFIMLSSSKNKKEALDFMRFAIRPESLRAWAGHKIRGRTPCTPEQWKENRNPEYKEMEQLAIEGKLFKNAIHVPSFPGIVEMEKLLGVAYQEAVLGKKTVKEALEGLQRDAQAVLDRIKK